MLKMLEWVGNTKEFKRDINSLKIAIKNKYEYPSYADDEMKVDITIKQLIYYLDNNIPRNSGDKQYKEALYKIIKYKKDMYFRLSPLDISFLREVYERLILDPPIKLEQNTKVKTKCDRLVGARDKGLIARDHFVFKIISTLSKGNYVKCSEKQYNIILDALDIVDQQTEDFGEFDRSTIVDVDDIGTGCIDLEGIDDSTLLDISNELGHGKFEE